MSEEILNQLVESSSVDRPHIFTGFETAIIWAQNEIAKLRAERDKLMAQQSPAVADVVEAVADFVEKQEGGPYMPQVISAAILGQLKYGDVFKNIHSTFDGTKSPRITEKDAREMYKIIRDIVQNYECGDEVDSKLRPLLNKLNARGE